MNKVKKVSQKLKQITKKEVWPAIRKMKDGKAIGPNDIPVEAWKCLGYLAVNL